MEQLRAQLESESALDLDSLLTKLEAEYLQEKRETGGQGRVAKFNYAVALSKSADHQTKRKALHLLKEAESTENAREVWYYAAVAHYQLRDYAEARHYVAQLLSVEPNNSQAKALEQLIHSDLQRDGLIGAGIGVAVLAAAALITVAVLKR